MQLKKKNIKITGLLASATCGLLGQAGVAQEVPGWYIDSAVLGYSEKDRVDAVEPAVSVSRVFEDGKKLNLKYVLDSLTGASPNGATISDQVQTFTRPSGSNNYIVAPGELPLDDTFKDSRSAVSAQYEFPLNRLTRISAGLAYSDEYDYTSLGFNASLARDFNNKNTTVSFGLAFASDTISPEGGIPTPFTSLPLASEREGDDDDDDDERDGRGDRDGSEEDKTTTDFLLGVTQVINRQTLMQLNYSYSSSDGYSTDPFKVLSVIDTNSTETLDYLYESRPDSREKHSVYWKTKYSRDNGHIIDFSYRYLWDDWDIKSHTADFRYRINFGDRFYVEPHLRYYNQQEANFYTHNLVAAQSLPQYASADYRLGAFDGLTYGSKLGFRVNDRSEVSIRLEQYTQTGDTVGSPATWQNKYPLFPDLEATILQLSYSYRF